MFIFFYSVPLYLKIYVRSTNKWRWALKYLLFYLNLESIQTNRIEMDIHFMDGAYNLIKVIEYLFSFLLCFFFYSIVKAAPVFFFFFFLPKNREWRKKNWENITQSFLWIEITGIIRWKAFSCFTTSYSFFVLFHFYFLVLFSFSIELNPSNSWTVT